jgi:hypothetical protein
MADPAVSVPIATEWEALQLQLIAFPTLPATDIRQEWWQELTGTQPEESVRKRQERLDQGPFDGRNLLLSADLLRFAWIVVPRLDPERLLETPLPTVGPFEESCDWFVALVDRWLAEFCPEVKRLGFVAKLARRTDDHASGYQELGRWLRGFEIDPESTDFLYRINRKRPSQVAGAGGLRLNRLSTWVVGKFSGQVSAQMLSSPATRTEVSLRDTYACVADLDINTPAERQEALPRDIVLPLFHELVGLAKEIAREGDVP